VVVASIRPLLERDPEQARVLAAVRRAAGGDPSLVIVEGAAGLGKTALLQAVRADIGDAATVLAARPAEHEADFAYGVVRQLLGAPLARLDPAARERLVRGSGAGALAALADDAAPPPPFDGSFGIVDGLYWLVAELAAQGPLTLVVDDAHWADAPSLRFHGHLLRRLDGLPVGVVIALRPQEPGTPLDLLDPLRVDPRAEVVALRPLSEEAVGRIVTTNGTVDAAFVHACHHASAGNPLYLRELIRAMEQDGTAVDRATVERVASTWPASVARHVGRRVAALGPDGTRLAEAMAVLGDGAPLDLAARVAEIDEETARTLALALRRMEVLAEEDPGRFEHPVVRAALWSELPPADRDALLRRAVTVLTDAGAPAEEIAAHLLELPPGGNAPVEALRRAAEEASARGAPDVAATYLRRALAEPPPAAERATTLHALGAIETQLEDELGWKHLREAIALEPDPAARAAWTLELSVSMAFHGAVPDAMEAVASAFASDDLPTPVRELLGANLCAFAWASSEPAPQADALLREYTEHPPTDPRSARLVLAARASRMNLPADEAAALSEKALADGLLAGVWLGNLLSMGTLVYTDRFASASAHLDEALELARATGSQSAIGPVHAMLADLAHATGDLARCETHAMLHLGPLRERSPSALSYTASILVRSLVDRGELERADTVLDELGGIPPVATSHAQYFLRVARGRLRCAQGRFRDGVDDLAAARRSMARSIGSTWSPIGFDGADAEPLALERLGRGDEARALVAASLPAARSDGPPRNLASTLRVAGVLERGPDGVALLEEAVAVLDGTGAQLELARTLVDLGTVRLRSGRRADARAALSRGHDLADDCGAVPLVARAREELVAAGARPRRDRVATGRAALTPSELRFAHMAAEGRTNREIAQELYVAQKTVEMHLGRAYQKLGIAGRKELAAALADEQG
jgi:DNA-binding CsgD family transcriptional regulator